MNIVTVWLSVIILGLALGFITGKLAARITRLERIVETLTGGN